jgi:hypothetical protein
MIVVPSMGVLQIPQCAWLTLADSTCTSKTFLVSALGGASPGTIMPGRSATEQEQPGCRHAEGGHGGCTDSA